MTAGEPATASDLVDVAKLVTAYYAVHPDPGDPAQRVSFGTSGHRGSAFTAKFNEDHIAATTQAICEYRDARDIREPLYLGATPTPCPGRPRSARWRCWPPTASMCSATRAAVRPAPAVSPATLAHNARGSARRADGS